MSSLDNKFKKMLQFQDETNNYITQDVDGDWRSQRYNWRRAIWIECAELMEHYGNWKWWKGNKEPDIDQCFLECVDIWHFALSWMLEKEKSVDGVLDSKYYRDLELYMKLEKLNPDDEHKHSIVHSVIEGIALNALEFQFDVRNFMQLIELLGKDFDDLYKWYIGKNVLNVFRNDHGYADGAYIKIWYNNDRVAMEDNEHLAELLNEVDVETEHFDMYIYDQLKVRYNVGILIQGIK